MKMIMAAATSLLHALLRAFRDGVLAHMPGGQSEIEEYYGMAPGIVAAINQWKDAAEIWNRVYDELVEPCVRMIHEGHEGHDERAYQHYKAYLLSLI